MTDRPPQIGTVKKITMVNGQKQIQVGERSHPVLANALKFAADIKEGDTVEYGFRKEGNVTGIGFIKKANPGQPTPPATCTSPAETPAPASTPNPSNPTGIKEVTLACTINLDSYENLRIEVTGSSADACKAHIVDTLKGYASTSPATKEKIARYMERVFGVI